MRSILRTILRWPGHLVRLGRRQASLATGTAVLIVFIVAGTIALDGYLLDLQVQDGANAAQTLSFTLAEQTDKTLQAASTVISDVVDRLQKRSSRNGQPIRSNFHNEDLQARMLQSIAEVPFLDGLYFVAADGQIEMPGSDQQKSVFDLHGEDYLNALRHAAPEAVYVSTPFQSTTSGTWQLSLAKRISAGDGSFAGIVGGVVSLPSFKDHLEKTAPGEHGSISIFREDGALIACYPQSEIAVGGGRADRSLLGKLIAARRDGVTRETSIIDGINRMFVVSHSEKFPVVSVVAIAMNEVVANWLRQAEALTVGAGVIILSLAFGAIRLAAHVEQLAAGREREAVQAQAEIQYRRFHNAMDNIVQGLAMYDQTGNLIACNRRYAEIYEIPFDESAAGATRAGSLSPHKSLGFGTPIGAPQKEPDGSELTICKLPDGRVIAQRKKKLSDGGWVSTHEDITSRRRAEDKVQEMATRDALTGLSNRFEFKQRLDQCLAEARRRTGKFAVLYLDLDNFKAVNDMLGHPVGDKLLQEVAARLRTAVRPSDTVARLGGDEFAIIQRVAKVPRDSMALANRLISAISEPYIINGAKIDIGTSLGISLAPDDSTDSDELIRAADMALYHSKANRGSYNFFQPSMDELVRSRRQMESDLRAAIAEEQFELHFQPIVTVAGRQVKSFEALLRWNHPEAGPISPTDFIPIAEESGLIVPIGEWVLREACKEVANWPSDIKIAINVSAIQFRSARLIPAITEAMSAAGIEGSRVIVEVTESVMIKDAEQAVAILHSLHSLGVTIAMDDFGAGYSSLSYLNRFPFDKIKIDKSFVGEIGKRTEGVAIVRAATSLAKALGMETVAEGIETEEQFAVIAAEGCTEAQGYLFRRPMRARDVPGYLNFVAQESRSQSDPALPAPAQLGQLRVATFTRKRHEPSVAAAQSIQDIRQAPAKSANG